MYTINSADYEIWNSTIVVKEKYISQYIESHRIKKSLNPNFVV